jgi:hypothetical protein
MEDIADWDWFWLDSGYEFPGILEFLKIPHYTNDYRQDSGPVMVEVRTVKFVDELDVEEFGSEKQLLIKWKADTLRPTDEQILIALRVIHD